MNIYDAVGQMRETSGISEANATVGAGLIKGYITRFLDNKSNVRVDNYVRIAHGFGYALELRCGSATALLGNSVDAQHITAAQAVTFIVDHSAKPIDEIARALGRMSHDIEYWQTGKSMPRIRLLLQLVDATDGEMVLVGYGEEIVLTGESTVRPKAFEAYGADAAFVGTQESVASTNGETADDVDAGVDGVSMERVTITALAPKTVQRDGRSTIDVVFYEDACRQQVERLAAQYEAGVPEHLDADDTGDGACVRIHLSSPLITVEDGEQQATWNARLIDFTFHIVVPADYANTRIPFEAKVYVNGFIATKIKFTVSCNAWASQKPRVTRSDIKGAFVCHADDNYSEVVAWVRDLNKALPSVNVFYDRNSLAPSRDRRGQISREVDRASVLYLCWTMEARESEQVAFEWRHALKTKGASGIELVPFVSTQLFPLPEELESVHVLDM